MSRKPFFDFSQEIQDIGDLERWSQEIVELLQNEVRWKERKEHGSVLYDENVSQHKLKTSILCMYCLLLEGPERLLALGINPFVVMCMVSLHDVGEGYSHDKNDRDKTSADEEKEKSAFYNMVGGLPLKLKEFFMSVYGTVGKRGKDPNADFFRAVEIVGYLQRAIAEVRAGHHQFADPFFVRKKIIPELKAKYNFFSVLVGPIESEMKEYMEKYPEWNPFKE